MREGTTRPQPLRIAALRAAYARSETGPARVVEEVLERLAAEPERHAWITRVPAADLRRRAGDLERRASPADAARRLPLYGIPFAVKDNIDVAGLPTTAGCPDFAYVPARAATAVHRLLDAGAILVGKTNLDQFATGLTGTRSPYGACESVPAPGLVSGGSSAGSAVVVAAGLVAFSLGTDTAGSGRVPAAMNGLVGLKPTRGLVSTAGVVPACRSLDCVSVMAHDVADAQDVLDAMTGVDPADPWSRRPPAAGATGVAGAGRPLRLGVIDAADLDRFSDPAMRRRYEAGCARAGRSVAQVQTVDIAPFVAAGDLLYDGPWVAERYAGLAAFLAAHPASVLPVTARVLARGRDVSGADAFRSLHRLRELRAEVERVWAGVDALLLPTVGTTFTLGQVEAEPFATNAALGRYTQFANLLDLAAVAVPNGWTEDGRPAGLSLLGPAFRDVTLARLARDLNADPAGGRPVRAGAAPVRGEVLLAVVGHHLSGGPRNHELTAGGGRLVETTRTADHYRLFRLGDRDAAVPGLLRSADGGASVEVELWALPSAAIGGLLDGIRPPLGLGRIELADGRETVGFLCEAYATRATHALDITASGGWRAYRSARRDLDPAEPTAPEVS